MLYKMSEWESPVSGWHCGCVDALADPNNTWWLPARILNISPAEYVELVITKFKPDHVYFNKEKCFFSFSWNSQTAERAFKNYINAAARKINFQIGGER